MITIIEKARIWLDCYILINFVAIKILLHYDCFIKNSGCLHTTFFTSNFDGISMFLHGHELDMNMTGSFRFELVAGGLGWLRMVSGGFGWLRMVSGGFEFFVVLVVTIYFHSKQMETMPQSHKQSAT